MSSTSEDGMSFRLPCWNRLRHLHTGSTACHCKSEMARLHVAADIADKQGKSPSLTLPLWAPKNSLRAPLAILENHSKLSADSSGGTVRMATPTGQCSRHSWSLEMGQLSENSLASIRICSGKDRGYQAGNVRLLSHIQSRDKGGGGGQCEGLQYELR